MKASELVKNIKSLMAVHGDMDVAVVDDDHYENWELPIYAESYESSHPVLEIVLYASVDGQAKE